MKKNSNFTVDHVIAAEQFEKEKQYWLDKLQGEPVKTHFPYDLSPGSAGALQQPYRQWEFHLTREIDEKLLSIANQSETRLFMLLTAGLVVLLHKYTGKNDIIIGCPIVKQEVQGDFVNTVLVLRHQLEDETNFKQLLYLVKQTLVEASENQNYPIKSLARELHLETTAGAGGNAFFDCMILLENLHDRSYIRDSDPAVIISFTVARETLQGRIDYKPALFDENTVKRIAGHYRNVFRHILFNPEMPLVQTPLLSDPEKQQLLVEFNQHEHISTGFNTIVDWFENQVEKTPGHIAVEYEYQKIDYNELNRKANQLARALAGTGVGRDTIIALMFRPSLEMIIAILAVLKAGGAYLPINPEFPETRIKYMIADCNSQYLVTSADLRDTLGFFEKNLFQGEMFTVNRRQTHKQTDSFPEADNSNFGNPGIKYDANDLAYVIYTSGTTGLPKGVLVRHRGIFNYIDWRYRSYGFTENDVTLQFLSYNFDGFMSNLFSSLLCGGTLVLIPDQKVLDFSYIAALIREKGVTNTSIVPRIFDFILENAGEQDLKSLRLVILAGEKAEKALVEKIKKKNPRIRPVNEYGPTEASVTAVANLNMEHNPTSVIGQPIAHTRILILSHIIDLVPIGVPGEIFITGAGLARGYLNHPDLTREKFLENPFARGTFVYRTGDRARWLPDGNIEFMGRKDFQVKIRGFRIELEEIEQQLLNHPHINAAVVTAWEEKEREGGGNQYLAAYIVTDQEIPVQELREYLAAHFPDYMIPAYFVPMSQFPLTASGKIHRKQLPRPEMSAPSAQYMPPRDQVEKQLVGIWAAVLGVDKDTVGINSNFFELGGHSLTATILANQVHKELDVKIPMIKIFESPFIRNLAEYIKKTGKELFTSIKPTEVRAYYPTSSAQNRLFIIHQLVPEATAYNVPLFINLEGKPDIKRMEQAFRDLMRRHESLRTSFEMMDGNPVQRVHPAAALQFHIKYDNDDKSDHPAAGSADTVIREKTLNFIRPFDLAKAPLLRVELLNLRPGENRAESWLLMVDMHHIITDGISLVILVEEFTALYNHAELPPLQWQYRDFSSWQQGADIRAAIKKQEGYWIRQFEHDIPVLNMPLDFPRPNIQSFAGSVYPFAISREQAASLNQLARSRDATLFMVLLAAFNILLAKICSQEDIVVGTPVAGRRHAEVEQIIGIFVNMLALRNQVEEEKTVSDWLDDVKSGTLEAFENQDYQFADLVEHLELERNVSRNPLFDVVFILQNIYDRGTGSEEKETAGMKMKPVTADHRSAQFDLSLQATEGPDNSLTFAVEYCTRLFRPETIARFMQYFTRILAAISENPGIKITDIRMISEEEKNRLLFEFNDTRASYPRETTLHGLFARQVQHTPDHIALLEEDPGSSSRFPIRALTYNQLDEKAGQLAFRLQEQGVQPDTVVGIMAERCLETIIGILAILKAGGAYLPIDPDYPDERISYMLKDSKVKYLVKKSNFFSDIFSQESLQVISSDDHKVFSSPQLSSFSTSCPSRPSRFSRPAHLAYIIYTSGTMGKPKGSLIQHGNVVRLLFNDRFQFDFSAQDTWTLFHSYCFDFSVWEMYGALLRGARLVLISRQTARDPERFLEVLRSERVTVLNQTPQAFYHLVHHQMQRPGPGLRLRYVIFGGDALNPSRLKAWQEKYPQTRLINMYGITETTVHVTYKEITRQDTQAVLSNIGTPIPTLTTYIVSPHLQPQPIGVAGEICVGGEGVCRGYLNRPLLTAEKFIVSPFRHRERLYCSGDLGRYCGNGDIEYLGRIDHQVKIRGYRIEPEEIAHRLAEHDQIKEVVVIAREKQDRDKYLCAYITSDHSLSPSQLRDFALKRLPEYMVPAYFMLLDRIPMTANGKINRKTLPLPAITPDEEYVPAGNEMEEQLAEVWTEVLGIETNNIGIDANFFDLGGHSLTATVMAAKIHKKLNIKLPLSEVFTTPTIRGLAAYLQGIRQDKYAAAEAVNAVEKREYYPLSSAQRRLNFIYQMEPQKTTYNLPTTMVLGKDIKKDKIETALKQLIARHESLRTSFIEVDRVTVQRVHRLEEIQFKLEFYPVESVMSAGVQESGAAISAIIEDFVRPFDLARAPLIRSCLIQLPDGNHTWLVDVHHIVSDGTTSMILAEDFIDLYAGNPLPELRIQYRDFSQWQNRLFAGEGINTQKKYWQNLYADAARIPRLQLPADHSRPKIFSFAGDNYPFSLETQDAVTFKNLAAASNSTLYMNVLTLLNTLFYKYTGQTDIIIGAGVAGRPHDDLQGIAGMFVNTLPMRNYPHGELTYETFLKHVNTQSVGAFENQDLQFEELIDLLALERDISRNPLFDVLMLVQNFRRSGQRDRLAKLDQLDQSDTGNNKNEVSAAVDITPSFHYKQTTSRLDMTIIVFDRGEEIDINIEYYTGIYKKNTIARFVQHFKQAVKQLNANPGIQLKDIDLFGSGEKEQLLYRFNDTAADYVRDKTIRQLFEEQVRQVPDRIALVEQKESVTHLTYRQLNEKANRLALIIKETGVKPNHIVGIMTERSIEMMAGILGILKAGGAYLPIDPLYPLERKTFILRDSQIQLLLSQAKWDSFYHEGYEWMNLDDIRSDTGSQDSGGQENPVNENASTDFAYVIYTSGSTGQPKGTIIAHYSLVNRLTWMQKQYPLDHRDTILQKTPYTFDVSVWEIFWWGISGACLGLLVPGGEKDPAVIVEAIEKGNVTVIHFVPSMLNAFLTYVQTDNAAKLLSGLKQVFASGEALPLPLVNRFNEMLYETNQTRLTNLYGPTEATIDVSFFDCSRGKTLQRVPIGKPIDNIKFYIVDNYYKLQMIGISGELCIAGDGLSNGYLNRPELTSEKFINYKIQNKNNKKFLQGVQGDGFFKKSPPGRRRQNIYKTADLARWLWDGNVEFLGRLDFQVKIRGFRVELQEIEARLLMHEQIKQAIVISTDSSSNSNPTQTGKNQENYLCAYIVSEAELDVPQLRGFLTRSLPDYMIPSSFIRIDQVPLTPNGKVDRNALDLIGQKIGTGIAYVAPQNEMENIIAEIWKQELNLEKVGIYDNFFDLGGNSLNIIRIRSILSERLGRDIPITKIFAHPTIDSFSRYLQDEEPTDIASDLKIAESADLMEETMQLLIGEDNE